METDERTRKVLEAGLGVFLRYGFKRTTMGDLAEAAGMSRPALYLVFPSKEEIFRAGLDKVLRESLAEIRAGLPERITLREKLLYAFDIWCVRPYVQIRQSPDAKDLLESSYGFAADVMSAGYAEFEKIVAALIAPAVKASADLKVSAARVAHVMTSSLLGLKKASTDATQLRAIISDLVEITLAGLGASSPAKPRRKE